METTSIGNIDGNDHQIYHLLNESIKGLKVSAYYYDLKGQAGTAIASNLSTMGLRVNGKTPINDDLSLLYIAEYAEQEKDAAAQYNTEYLNLEAGITLAGITAKLAYELQSSDNGNTAFTTPLGTNHSFNGWADLFLSTPNTGLVDSAITFSSALLGPKIALTYHQFDSDVNNIDFGNEIDLAVSKKFTENYSGLFKLAKFDGKAEGGKPDTTKVWLQLQAKF